MADFYNRSALRRHALKVSDTQRRGKFTRVSEEFLDGIVAEIENERRRLRATVQNGLHDPVPVDENFLTGAGSEALVADFNEWVGKTIARRVHQTRTGKTL